MECASLVTAEPPASAPAADAGFALSPATARELVTRLARAVQRATIYPPGHPSVRLSTTPFVEALRGLRAAEVLVGFTSDSVFLGTHPRDARPFDLPWMSSRLSARGLASLRIEPRISLEEAERLIVWLAGADDLLAPHAALPVFDGAVVGRVDFAAVRFRDEAREAGAAGTSYELAWQSVSHTLAGDWMAGASGAAVGDPAALAGLVRDAIERHEGTGVREIGERLVEVGVQLAGMPEDVQAAVKGRLATFVTALPPELRRQVLTATPGDDPDKLALLGGVVNRLPSAVVLEMIQGAELTRGGSSHQFLSFMLKLAGLAATEPQLAEAFEGRCSAAGLPRDLAYFETPQLRAVLQDLLESRPDDAAGIAPEEYQQRLEAISSATAAAQRGYDATRHVAPGDASGLSRQNARIALHLLQGAAIDPSDQAMCLDRLLQVLPDCAEQWQADLLAGAVAVAARLVGPGVSTTEVAEKAGRISAWFERPAVLRAVIARIEGVAGEPSPELLTVARAGGEALAGALLSEAIRQEAPQVRERLSRALAWLDPDAVRRAVTTACQQGPRRARALLAALAAAGAASPVAYAALLLLADGDPLLRCDAFRLLFGTQLSTARFEAIVGRGLEDANPRVVELAVDEARRRPQAGVRPLAALLERRVPAVLAPAQRHAVNALAAMGMPEAREGLRASLAVRRTRFDVASRRVSVAIFVALLAGGDPEDALAARAWRRSPAGWVTRLFGSGGQA